MRILIIGALLALVVIAVALNRSPEADESSALASATTTNSPGTSVAPMLGNSLALTNLDGWLQSDVSGLDGLRGRVVIVQFWTFGCHNCTNTIPHLQDIYAEYKDDGLEIVGVHTPEFDYESDPEAILIAAQDLGVTWPIALDTERRNFHAWQGSPAYWPRTYVLDQNGLIRFDHVGEGAYDELEQTVAALLGG